MSSGHLRSNGATDSVIEDSAPPPSDLVGLDMVRVLERLGKPEIARHEGDILYWRFSTGNCLLDLYLSSNRDTGEIAVEHMALRPRSPLVPLGACPTPDHDTRREL